MVAAVKRLRFRIGYWVGGLSSSFHTGHGNPSLSFRVGLSIGQLKTWLLVSPSMNGPKDRATKTEATVSLNDLVSEVAHLHFYIILFVSHEVQPPLRGRETWTPPLDGKSIREFVGIFLKPPHRQWLEAWELATFGIRKSCV